MVSIIANNKFITASQMADRSFRSSRRSKTIYAPDNRQVNYRVILKSRSGLLNDFCDSVSMPSKKDEMNKTGSTLRNQDIKSFVKSMKAKTPGLKNYSTRMLFNSNNEEEQRLSSMSVSHSKLEQAATPQSQQVNQHDEVSRLSLEELQKKVDQLIKLKLFYARQNKNKTSPEGDQISRQLSMIVQVLQFFINEDTAQRGADDLLDSNSRRIGILEKIIAESAAESQIAKKYFGKKIMRKGKTVYPPYKIDLKLLKMKADGFLNNKAPSSLHFESISRSNYKAPDKQAYPPKPATPTYTFKNQPLHRSSYDRDYLVYGNLPRMAYKEQSSSQIMPAHTVGHHNSNYRSEFTTKKMEKIDFKQLDCYHDKFKNLKVSFFPEKPSAKCISFAETTLTGYSTVRSKNERLKTEPCHYSKNLATENKFNFKGETRKIVSEIKHKNLHNLKYIYRAQVKA